MAKNLQNLPATCHLNLHQNQSATCPPPVPIGQLLPQPNVLTKKATLNLYFSPTLLPDPLLRTNPRQYKTATRYLLLYIKKEESSVDLDVPLSIFLELLKLVVPRDASLSRHPGQHVGDPRHHSLYRLRKGRER